MIRRTISPNSVAVLQLVDHYIAARPEAATVLRPSLAPDRLALRHSPDGFSTTRRKHRPTTQSRRELWGVSQQEADALENILKIRAATATFLKRTAGTNRSVVQFSLNEPGVIFGAGLLGRAARTLKAAGYRVIVQRDGVSFDPTTNYVHFVAQRSILASPLFPALQALQRHPRLYFAAESQDEKLNLMLVLARLFPTERMLILVKDLLRVQRLAHELACIRNVYIPGRLGSPSSSMVVIDTLSGHDWRAYGGFGVVCLYDAELLTSLGALQRVRKFVVPAPVRIAFGPPATRLNACEELDLEATFGPLIRRPAAHQAYVAQLRLPATKRRRYANGLERKEASIWYNDPRNQLIATLAQAVASGGLQGLPGVHALFDDHNCWAAAPRRTCILVETMKHARNVAELMPDWQLVGASDRYGDGDVVFPNDGNFIATLDRAAGKSLDGFAVVLADGALRRWPDELCRGSTWSSMVLVDVADAFDKQAADDARGRRDDYARRGWHVTTINVCDSEYRSTWGSGTRSH